MPNSNLGCAVVIVESQLQVEAREWVRRNQIHLFVSAAGNRTEEFRYPPGIPYYCVPVTHKQLREPAFEEAAKAVEGVLYEGRTVVQPPPQHCSAPHLHRRSALGVPNASPTSIGP